MTMPDIDKVDDALSRCIAYEENPTCKGCDFYGVSIYRADCVAELMRNARLVIAELKSKQGKKVEPSSGVFYREADADEWYMRPNVCATCGKTWMGSTNYCPNCGIKLKEVNILEGKDESGRCD